ncbi:hypothetical protein LPJ59_006112, partial [Coemansia sp. RSA 2399]
MSSETPPIPSPDKQSEDNDGTKLTSETLRTGDPITEPLLSRLAKLEKYEHKLAEVARVYRNLNTARKAVETVLKNLTPVQSIADVEELEAYLSNLNMKSQYAGEQIGALTELDKSNRAKIADLETHVSKLQASEKAKQKELEAVARERKVAEGQLERTNQKLKLDISSLETKLADKKEEAPVDAESLASRLTELISDKENKELGAKSESMDGLYKSIVDRWGIPEGLVSASELEAAARALESCQQEVAQVKDIMRKEIDASEGRLQQLSEEKSKEIARLNEQLKGASADKEHGLSPERVTEIISAAVAGNLVGSKPAAANTVGTGGAKKKANNNSKKKRRGTTNTTPSPSPSLSATNAADESADSTLEATKREIAQLVELIGSAGIKSEGSSEKLKETTNVLDAQLADARKEIEKAQSEAKEQSEKVEQLRADISQLQTKLGQTESQRDKLAQERDGDARSGKRL